MAITKELIGELDGRGVFAYTLDNGTVSAQILSLGGIVKRLIVPDRNGNKTDVVLGRGTLEDYTHNDGYLGALIGRHANRIAGGKFTLGGREYSVGVNEGKNSLHGGFNGFDKKIWSAVEYDGNEPRLAMAITSADGEEGFPGRLSVVVTYTITRDNALKINYRAESDADTVVNLTNHSYFNLAGHDGGDISGQVLQINSAFYTPNNDECMPTGEVLSVAGTPFDFRVPKPIGQDIDADFDQIKMFGGYDHNFALSGRGYRLVAVCSCEENGVSMEVYTDAAGMQLYTSNGLNKGVYKDGAVYDAHHAFCLETQYFPNSMAISHFPSPVLKAGEEYNTTTEYRFSVR